MKLRYKILGCVIAGAWILFGLNAWSQYVYNAGFNRGWESRTAQYEVQKQQNEKYNKTSTKKQAAKYAKLLIEDTLGYSKESIANILKNEGFSDEDIAYAISEVFE